MLKRAAIRPATPTRGRILHAAARQFAHHSYEETGLRDLAADADVDVAHAHRLFGSKEELFAEALKAVTQPGRTLAEIASAPAPALAKEIFRRDTSDEIRPFDIAIHSFSSPKALGVMREFVLQSFIEPLSKQLGASTAQRAALILAILTGVAILRNVLHVDCLLEGAGGPLERHVADLLAHLIESRSAGDDTTGIR